MSWNSALAQKGISKPVPVDPVQAEREGRELVARLLAAKPPQGDTNMGLLKIRDGEGNERVFPVRFEISVTPTNWATVYETVGSTAPRARLVVTRSEGTSSQYWLSEPVTPEAPASGRALVGGQSMVPFAGSDFWVADLGLEFLGWPKQWLLRKELRRSQSCDVLESSTPLPATNGYARVVSWIERESGGIVHAEAYNARGDLIKRFDPKGVKKVDGEYQLEEMEIVNRQTGSRTTIKFGLQK